ncbi:uncharacterized protein LOC125189497 [Salvia hispanica]|uniref:uncharacterized protein LOC125189497 n=1 Tax=Salvia hispanica TaxID=49212 RepID=UPI002009CC16|nr:uncharacterized protein LOC125189497 [Salvia hispanica]
MVKDNRISVLAIIEPLIKPRPDIFSKVFGLRFKGSNCNGQIWVFVAEGFEVDNWDDTEQIFHGRFLTPALPAPIYISVAYGKYSKEGREGMWTKLRELAAELDGLPWLVGGDFNIFVSEEERQGSVRLQRRKVREMVDFAEAISDCQLLDLGADGPKFTWARGDTFERLKKAEQEAKEALERYEQNPTPEFRSEINKSAAEYILRLKMEDDYWRQKVTLKWVAEGDRNSKFFQGSLGEPDLGILSTLPSHVNMELLEKAPSTEEIRKVVFSINAESAAGPDGYSGLFFQACWEIIGADVVAAVLDFFAGSQIPRGIAATLIVLIPKKENPSKWAEFRPISLCNVMNKIISKLLASRLAPLLPLIIAPNQSGFIKGRLLSDNVLLAKELFHEIWKGVTSPNMVLKLDMEKAYDRVQWPFLLKILKKMGFSDRWVKFIENCISPCWFSILINGSGAGFFKSSRGLRQEDPISPSLFALAADYLSRLLDRLILGRKEMMYCTARYTMGISHLAYADDIIIFSQAQRSAILEVKDCLNHYMQVSGQKVNVEKSCFYLDKKHLDWAEEVKEVSGFQQGCFPFLYLGVPIFKGPKKTSLFMFIRERISARIHSWGHRHLSFGGRLTLIRSVLGALPIHIFQVLDPTKGALKLIEQVMGRFLWGSCYSSNKTHWIKWQRVCLPTSEGVLGIRSLADSVEAFSIKMWWRLRELDSLWAQCMYQKYCSYSFPLVLYISNRFSPTWRRLFKVGDICREQVRWVLGNGNISVWYDSWVLNSPLASLCSFTPSCPSLKVSELWWEDQWDEMRVRLLVEEEGFSEEIAEKILQIPFDRGARDRGRWKRSSNGDFSTASAWDLVRKRAGKRLIYEMIWGRSIGLSISMFLWRLIANRVPVDTKMQWRGISLASKCRCCAKPQVESRLHLFVNGEAARRVWHHFSRWFPQVPPFVEVGDNIELRFRWWQRHLGHRSGQHLCTIIPCLVFWFIWLERNENVHREKLFEVANVVKKINAQLRNLVLAKILGPVHWKNCSPQLDVMGGEACGVRRRAVGRVQCRPPDEGWLKLNVDGAFSQSLQRAGGRGVLRNFKGDIIAAFSAGTEGNSGVEAEAAALLLGVLLVKQHGSRIWIESDANLMVRWLASG